MAVRSEVPQNDMDAEYSPFRTHHVHLFALGNDKRGPGIARRVSLAHELSLNRARRQLVGRGSGNARHILFAVVFAAAALPVGSLAVDTLEPDLFASPSGVWLACDLDLRSENAIQGSNALALFASRVEGARTPLITPFALAPRRQSKSPAPARHSRCWQCCWQC